MPQPQPAPLNVGDKAPAPVVTVDDGSKLKLTALYKEGPVLIYFYPKSDTPGCTRQACNIRDNISTLNKAGIAVLGVSKDKVEAQAKFKAKYDLNFPIVADPDKKLIEAFGVSKRQSFIVVGGKIAWRALAAKPDTQAQDALKALDKLNN